MVSLKTITSFLDTELNIKNFSDESNNGLQVENTEKINRVCLGVDASLAFFKESAKRKANLVICHHGLSWGDSLKYVTGLNYRRLKFLLDNNIALYACHFPLDLHPRYGNNAQLCGALGVRKLKPFGSFNNIPAGFSGTLPSPIPYKKFKERVRRITGNIVDTMDFGKDAIRTVAVVSGGAASKVEEAGEKGIDVYITGEPNLTAYNLAQEYGINVIFAGHYATETFGVKALARLLASRFKVKTEFLNMKVRF